MHRKGSGAGSLSAGLAAAVMEHFDAPDWAWIVVALLAAVLGVYWLWSLTRPPPSEPPNTGDTNANYGHQDVGINKGPFYKGGSK